MRHLILVLLLIILSIKVKSQITGIKIIGDTCTDLTFDLQAVGLSNSPYFSWNFGDLASGVNNTSFKDGTSLVPYPTHTFSSIGKYKVCVSFKEPGQPEATFCKTYSIGLCCNGIITATDSCVANSIPFAIITDEPIVSIDWNFGDPNSGMNNASTAITPSHLFSQPGNFTVSANVTFPCGVKNLSKIIAVNDCNANFCRFTAPDAFTPKVDGSNDLFFPLTNCIPENYELLIYNRWGDLVFYTNSRADKWDGKFNGIDCTADVFTYVIHYKFPAKSPDKITGAIMLIR
jgi:gliding motility-associated-like protein